jgi:uncharacterized protein involved in outer membrane biogenesis
MNAERSRLLKTSLRWVAIAIGALLALWLLAWLVVPPLIKAQSQARLSQLLGREVRLEAVEFRPWSLTLTLRGLSIGAATGAVDTSAQFSVERIVIDADAKSLLRLAPVVSMLSIDAPHLRVARLSEGHYDIDDILQRFKRAPGEQPSTGPPRFALYNLQLRDGAISVDDRPAARRHELKDAVLTLPFLSDLPSQVDITVEPRLAFMLDGTRFDTGAQSTPFARSHATSLHLHTGEIDLAPWRPYLPHELPVDVQHGRLKADVDLHFAVGADSAPSLTLRGDVQATDWAAADRTGAPLAAWRALQVKLADVQPLAHSVMLGPVRVEGLELRMARDAQGALPLGSGSAEKAQPASPSKPWKIGVESIDLVDARLSYSDAALQPALNVSVDALQAHAGPLAWPQAQPAALTLSAQVKGESAQRVRLQARAALDATLQWAAEPARLQIGIKRAAIDELHAADLATPSRDGGDALGWAQFEVADTDIDVVAHHATVGRVRLVRPRVQAQRSEDGVLAIGGWRIGPGKNASSDAKSNEAPAASSPASSPASLWQVHLREAGIDDAELRWRDARAVEATTQRTALALDVKALNVSLRNAEWPAGRPAELQMSARIVEPAARRDALASSVDWHGQVAAQPLSVRGALQVRRFPLHVLEPYMRIERNIVLQRAEASWRGDVALRLPPGGLEASARGTALLAGLRLNARDERGVDTGDELLSWQALRLNGLDLALAPRKRPRVAIADASLSDFYSRLVVSEEGRFNLRDAAAPTGAASSPPGGFAIGRPAPAASAANAAPPPEPVASAASAAPPSESAASAAEVDDSDAAEPQSTAPAASAASASPAPSRRLPVDFSLGGLRLANGRIDFSDHFVRPNYSAVLSDLNGSLGGFRSDTRDMAQLELRGKMAGTADLDIRGNLNPLADPLALDVGARATDLELAPLSPYAGKYVGYAIERGKLSMDVHYNVQPDGRLAASNHVVLNQLTFGEKVDSPQATKLPVRLAVALLKNKDGVIDLDLPVNGSVHDPKFSVGRIILKIIVNLVTKVVTSPFALLAHAGEGGPDLSSVEFMPGTARLAESAHPGLDKVAKALIERPALKMTVTGAADPASERAAMQSAQLEQALLAQRRREQLRAGNVPAAADTASGASAPAPVSGEERTRLLRELYERADIPDKPRNVIGLTKDLPPAEIETMLKSRMVIDTDSARELALQRGIAVRDALVARGLASDRLFLAEPKVHSSAEGDAAWVPRVTLVLSVQ